MRCRDSAPYRHRLDSRAKAGTRRGVGLRHSGGYNGVPLPSQAYDKKLTEVEAQRAALQTQKSELQKKLRDLASASAEEQARLKAQYVVRLKTTATQRSVLRCAFKLRRHRN